MTINSGPANSVFTVTNISPVPGTTPFQPFMNNGQVAFRVWTIGNNTNVVDMTFADSSPAQKFSSFNIPYSLFNTPPVKATLSPSLVLDGSVTTLSYVIKNQFSSPISYLSINIPPNSSGV